MTANAYLMVVLWCFYWCNWLLPSLSDQALSPWQQRRVQEFAQHVMACGRIPGMSLSVIRGPHSWTLPLGVANLSSQGPVRNETRFAIGSLSKAITSTLLVSLLRRTHKWSVDTPLATILGIPDLFADDVRSRQATVKDILSHRLGLARADLALFAGYPADFSLADLVSGLTCLPEQKAFRSGYVYSNVLYGLAGYVVERLTNQSFAEALRSGILDPLEMSATGPYDTEIDSMESTRTMKLNLDKTSTFRPSPLAVPYVFVKDQLLPADPNLFRNLGPFLPALGLASNGPDMVRWMRLQLSTTAGASSLAGRARGLFPRSVLAATHEPVTPHIVNNLRPRFPEPDLTFAYGLGWQQAVYKGFRRAWHSGSLFGFASQIWLLTDLDFGLFVAVNGPARSPHTQNRLKALLYYVTDIMLGDKPWLDKISACSYPSPPSVSAPPSPRARKDYRRRQNTPNARFAEDNQATQFKRELAMHVDVTSLSPYLPSRERHSSYVSPLPWASLSTTATRSSVGSAAAGLSLSSLLSSSVAANFSVTLDKLKNEKNMPIVSMNLKKRSVIHRPRKLPFQTKILQRYEGVYFNKLFGKVSVTYVDTHVWSRSKHKKANSTMVEKSDLQLECDSDEQILCWPKTKSKHSLNTSLKILFGKKFSGILIYSDKKQNFTDISRTSIHTFEMTPTGIFEFSAYSENDEGITMPVQFSDFDINGVPNVLKAVWQEEEVLEFSRDRYRQMCRGPKPIVKALRNTSNIKVFTYKILTHSLVGVFVLSNAVLPL
ncbi:protein flp [Elysia marginata]|uniref:Protein flp n=1 Tax=Elysia marginata TaxID=1093978 RepID=A0AAV4JT49_9GAST|nr:protein flp [Elysia marginata]